MIASGIICQIKNGESVMEGFLICFSLIKLTFTLYLFIRAELVSF
jgi:hypothetical protein